MTNSVDFIAKSNEYINFVIAGDIPACVEVVEACRRQKEELLSPPDGYFFDESKAVRACSFISLLPHIKGELRGELIKLEPWQCFILTTIFGWVDADGYRRFKTAYIEVPRKNAKSTLSSGVALYCLLADGEGGAEVYSAATTREQARIVFRDAVEMVKLSPDLRDMFGVEIMGVALPHNIVVNKTNSSFKALSRDQGGNLDGLNIHCGVIDELHAHKTRDVFDVIETGTGARRQPLLWLITTSGFNRSGICYEQRMYTKKILNGSHNDPEYFGIIYTIDNEDDWMDEHSWAKANPNWGISVNPKDIARKARKAIELPSATNNFLTKHLNVWVNADTAWMNMRLWDAQGDTRLQMDDFLDCECWMGLDLATKTDIAALALLFKKSIEGKDNYYLFGKYWLPEETVDSSPNSQYQGWARSGIITTTDGNIIDFDVIEAEIKDLASKYNVIECCFDPYQATQISTRLAKEGIEMVEVGATVANFSEPMKELEALVLDGRLHHVADPCLTWQISNVVAHVDAKENIFPRKETSANKIDIVVSAIMALNRAMFREDTNKVSIYDTQELFVL